VNTVVDEFLSAVTAAAIPAARAWTADATLDATTPGWRTTVRGANDIRRLFAGWYADEGRFEELERTPLPYGELVQFLLTWTEHGVPHAARQAHVVTVSDGLIARHVVYCGGRWPAGLLARMAEAGNA
jgi:hypothetical protein